MQLRPRAFALLTLCASLPGCQKAADQATEASTDQPTGGVYAKILAETAERECLRGQGSASDPAQAAKIQQVCACTKDKIIAAEPGAFEDEESRRTKMKDALDACVAEVGAGAAG